MARKLTKKTNKVQKIVKKVKQIPAGVGTASVSKGSTVAPEFNLPQGDYLEAVGRRKTATARVRVYKAAGDFIVNQKAAGQYFSDIANAHVRYTQPFTLTDTRGLYAVSAKVSGSGSRAQLEAVIHGLARALTKMDAAYRPALKAAGLLTRDDRMKETRKIGTGGKARRKRQSPKR